jgi:alpha-tubulin suppressor-like RCC1 family protein
MTRILPLLPTSPASLVRALFPMVLAACGFAPQPKSGTVSCKQQGAACCPAGYLCVGRGLSTAGGPSAGICWNQAEMPPEAVASAHDYTPAIASDPSCRVTDWLPPELVGVGVTPDGGLPGPGGPVGVDPGTRTPVVGADAAEPVTPVRPVSTHLIAAGGNRTYVLSNGKLLGWGEHDLGDGTTLSRAHPMPVLGLEGEITDVSVGYGHSCAVVDKTVKCWGDNADGCLGDGTLQERLLPITVNGLSLGFAVAVAASGSQTCAIIRDGAWCWGDTIDGNYGVIYPVTSPVEKMKVKSGVTAIATGYEHTCVIAKGQVRCWGYNTDGQLGDNTTKNSWVPVDVVGLGAGATAISANGTTTCALVSGGVRCWGTNDLGQLGDGTRVDSRVPVQVVGLPASATAITVGGGHTCAIVGGGVFCWGWNLWGQLGAGLSEKWSATPVQVVGLESGVLSIAAGGGHTCARTGSGVKCWGDNTGGLLENSGGQLGVEGISESNVPVDVQFQ